MDSKKRRIYTIVVFCAVCIWGYYNIFDDGQKKKAGEPEDTKTIEAVTVVSATPKKTELDLEKCASQSWGKDPFYRSTKKIVKKQAPAGKQTLWILGGILYNENNPAAVINKSIVRRGETIDGAKVVNISRKNVTLIKNGVRFELNISKEKS